MCKKMFVAICGLLLVSYATSSQAIIIEPIGPIISDNNQFSSIEAFEANLQSQQQQLQSQLRQITQQLKSLQNFITAQKALGIQWVDASNGQYPKNALSLKYGADQTAHICHTTFIHGTHPGILNNAGCLITYGGSSLIEQTYQVLTGKVTTHWQIVDSLDNYQRPEQNANNDTWQQHSVPIQGGYEKSLRNIKPNQSKLLSIMLNILVS
jgi:hypothetical protein